MRVLTLLLLFCSLLPAQSPLKRFPWHDGLDPAQEYPTYRQPWTEYRSKVETFHRDRHWRRWFVASSFAVVGSSMVYAQSRANSPSATSARVVSLGVTGGLLALEFLTNRDGRRDKDYSLINLGVTGSFAALTVQDQLQR